MGAIIAFLRLGAWQVTRIFTSNTKRVGNGIERLGTVSFWPRESAAQAAGLVCVQRLNWDLYSSS